MNKVDKSLVNKRFKKSIYTYDDNAIVQKEMANNLIHLLSTYDLYDFNTVFEIGCGTGFLTELLTQSTKYKKIILNDLILDFEGIIQNKINSEKIEFIGGDVESINFSEFKTCDLVISNASLQWLNDFETFADNVSSKIPENGIFAFSSFCQENMIELKKISGIGLNYLSLSKYKEILSKYFIVQYAKEEFVKLHFSCSIDIIKHIKNHRCKCSFRKTVD